MNDIEHNFNQALMVDRVIAELHRNRNIVVYEETSGAALIVTVAESINDDNLLRFQDLAHGEVMLLFTAHHMKQLVENYPSQGAVRVPLIMGYDKPMKSEAIHALIGLGDVSKLSELGISKDKIEDYATISDNSAVGKLYQSVVQLMKLTERIPASIVGQIFSSAEEFAENNNMLAINSSYISTYEEICDSTLEPIVTSPLKTNWSNDAKITGFRSRFGGKEHYAIIIGNPEEFDAPLVRIHSSCYTGDLLASLRCDCRDQLHDALHFIGNNGVGVVLYLMQEGRGIGLINKLRTYALQAKGVDTVEANNILGFDDDERPYLAAANMLKKLGLGKICLITNNPRKSSSLEKHGIIISERIALQIHKHEHNENYINSKSERLGHLINQV